MNFTNMKSYIKIRLFSRVEKGEETEYKIYQHLK